MVAGLLHLCVLAVLTCVFDMRRVLVLAAWVRREHAIMSS